jgi:hypothetical protein
MLPRAVLWPPRAKINLPAAISSYPETSLQPRPRHPIRASGTTGSAGVKFSGNGVVRNVAGVSTTHCRQGEPHKVGSITASFLLTDLSRYIVDVSIGNVTKAR